jgi:hypothetical protein
MLNNYAEVNRKIGFYGYDGDAFSSKKIKNLEEQAEKLKFDILRCIYKGEEGDDLK